MNKMKIISSVVLGVTTSYLSIANSNAYIANAVSASLYTFTNDAYTISYEDNSIVLRFRNVDNHNKINDIRLHDKNSNKLYNFQKKSLDFVLPLTDDLKSGNYTLIFNDNTLSASNSKEMYVPIYIDFPEASAQSVSITSLNPLVSLINSNGVYKLNARFNILNIQDTITEGKILNEQGVQIGFLENTTNPRNYIFNLGSTPLTLGANYYIEYTLKDNKKGTKTIKVPFTYTSNSINLNQLPTNKFTYTSTLKEDKTVDLKLNFDTLNVNDISFYDSYNLGIQLIPTVEKESPKGELILSNLPVDRLIQVQIKNGITTQVLYFKTPNQPENNPTPINFIKFINTQGLILRQGVNISVPLIKEDLVAAELNTPNTYAKFVTFDEFGNETNITNETKVSTTNSVINFTANMNVGTLNNDSTVYLKVYNPTRSVVYPFNIVTSSATSQSLAFDIVKNNGLNNKVSLTFKPNGNVLSQNETFSNGDMLIINDQYNATLSNDRKSFNIDLSKNQLKNGTNTYKFIRNNSSGVASYINGEFLANTASTNVKIGGIVDNITSTINDKKELVLQIKLNDSLPNHNSYSSVKIYDEQGKQIDLKSTVKQVGLSKTLEVTVSPYTKFINGKHYTLEISGANSFKTTFVYNKDTKYELDLSLVFNSPTNFTLKNLSTIPGSHHNFNLKIYNSNNENDVLYENFKDSTQGELLKTDSITKDLISGKTFIDGNNYTIQVKDTVTGDIYKQPFTFAAKDLISSNSGQAELPIDSNSINYSTDSILFKYELPSGKTVSSIKSGIDNLTATFTDGKITIGNLIPNKLYKDLFVKVTFNDGSTQTVKIGNFTSQSSNNELKNYLSKVYTTTLTSINEKDKSKMRYADESGFNYWYDLLSNKKISAQEFILQIIDANEFNSVQSTSQDKMRALYPIIVNRYGDDTGVNFWINDFNESIKKFNSEDLALKTTIIKMLNESEPKQFFNSIGIRTN